MRLGDSLGRSGRDRKAADGLLDGGTLALLSYLGLDAPPSASDQQALQAALARIAPELAAPLFEDAQLAVVPRWVEHTSQELTALPGTMSFWARLSPRRRDALGTEHDALHRRLGRPMRSSTSPVSLGSPRPGRTLGALR